MSAGPLQRWWQSRSPRERALVAACAVGTVLVAGDSLFTAPLAKRVHRAQAEVHTKQVQLAEAETAGRQAQAEALTQREQEARLRERLQAAQAASRALRERAADATQLPQTLRAVIATVGSARLLALELGADASSPPAAGAAAAATTTAAAAAASAPAAALRHVHRLPITLKVAGSYDELQLVLAQIERHAEALQWTQLTLDNSEWPAIQLTLKAHVPSLSPSWGAGS